ncbi:MAG: rhomboid family intramembrane serine protease [Actinobacteria bacterium]|nr:rhomboid family intramembrane serine protease [Actinomycetota bacterium]
MLPLKDNIPTRRFPIVTVALIAINVVMFFGFQHAHWNGHGFAVSESNTIKYAFIPYELTHVGKHCGDSGVAQDGSQVAEPDRPVCQGETVVDQASGQTAQIVAVNPRHQPSVWLTILTSMFMHGGLLHIAGNMLFLWIFGNNVEDSMARPVFVAFYLMGGLAATLLQTVVGPNSTVPNLGASGAIAAVLGGYALLYPRARVITLIFIIFFITLLELPALFVLGAWFLLQVLDAGQSAGGAAGGVAYFAHIGGFAFGLATVKLLAHRRHDDYAQPRLPVY